jgi:hypothetical protein
MRKYKKVIFENHKIPRLRQNGTMGNFQVREKNFFFKNMYFNENMKIKKNKNVVCIFLL